MAKPPSHVVSLFNGQSKNTSADAILAHMQSRAEQKVQRFDKVIKAIDARDINEVSWELLSVAVEEIAEKGATTLGRTTLMELVRTLSQQERANDGDADREGTLTEMKAWLRKKAE